MRGLGHASAMVIGMLSQPPEARNGGYRLRVAVVERLYDKSTRMKTEHTDWLWLEGKGPVPTLNKGEMLCAELKLRSVHEPDASERIVLQIVRIVPIDPPTAPPSRQSTRGQAPARKVEDPW